MKVSLIIVTYNNEKTIYKCINSFFTYLNNILDEVIIIDNASKDRTVDLVRKISDPRIRLIINKENLGYRKAVNLGIKITKNELVIVSNADVYLIDGSLLDLIEYMLNNPDVAIGDPVPLNQDNFSYKPIIPCILNSKIKLRDLLRYKYYMDAYIGGGSIFVIRKRIFEEVGGLNENCFMYGEENELSLKILKKGYRIIWDPQARVYHEVSHSVRSTDKNLKQMLRYSFYCSIIDCYRTVYNRKMIEKILFIFVYLLFIFLNTIYKRNIKEIVYGMRALLYH